MSAARRTIVIVLFAIVALAAVALYQLTSNLNGIVAGLIEEQGSAATQTGVSVGGVDIKLREASAALSSLSIDNPEEFSGTALELGHFAVQLDPGSLTSDVIVVKSVVVDSARINVLQQGKSNNLQQLLNNLQSGATSEPTADESAGKKVIIEKFTLSGASASVSIPELDQLKEVELPTIVLTDVGKASNGATGAQIARQILEPVIERAISSAAAESVKDAASKKIGEAVGGMLKGLGRKD